MRKHRIVGTVAAAGAISLALPAAAAAEPDTTTTSTTDGWEYVPGHTPPPQYADTPTRTPAERDAGVTSPVAGPSVVEVGPLGLPMSVRADGSPKFAPVQALPGTIRLGGVTVPTPLPPDITEQVNNSAAVVESQVASTLDAL